MKTKYLIIILMIWMLNSCDKGILDKKPNQSLLVPTSLADYQAILDNINIMNSGAPSLQNIAADDFFITDNGWRSLTTPMERNSYVWSEDVYENWQDIPDWNNSYRQIFYTNIVLDGISRLTISSEEQAIHNRIKGSALFYRAYAYYQLTQLFAKPYYEPIADKTKGIPIRISSDVNKPAVYGSLKSNYEQIIKDLMSASDLLEIDSSDINTRPRKSAVFALLSRIYLSMNDHNEAKIWANRTLAMNKSLLDYNTLTIEAARPFPRSFIGGNVEIIFYSTLNPYSFDGAALTFVDSTLYDLYEENDLRKFLFFKKGQYGYNFRGTYTGVVTTFSGLSTSEIYLTRAECYARSGEVELALQDLNYLLSNRFKEGYFEPVYITDKELLLKRILMERRKELIGRGIRWTDLRRLNVEGKINT